MVKFISYDGKYPCLCMGTLKIEVEGKVYTLGHCLRTGGHVWFDDEWCEHVEEGRWSVCDLPDELEKYEKEIEEVVNENVSWGCCGGCV